MIGWLDAASGASGDMLLGALIDAGADEGAIRAAVGSVAPERVQLTSQPVMRGSLAARQAVVEARDSSAARGLSAVLDLIAASDIPAGVAEHATAVFRQLGETEAAVHATTVEDVHFHEVGALDAIADIVGACAGFVDLGFEALTCSPVAVGSGTVTASHGTLSVPVPAVVRLLRGVPSYAGPVAAELCTPTGAALLRHWVTEWGPQPAMTVTGVGVGAGSRDFSSHPNVLRLLVGEPAAQSGAGQAPLAGEALVVETNVDDLDPRLWPRILALLLERGASDAWLTPILMKKGRAAHTLSVLVRAERAEAIRATIYAETTAIGTREHAVAKNELDREIRTVTVDGCEIRVKVARLDGAVVNKQPEYDDVVAAADALALPAKAVLALAAAEAARLTP